MESPTALEIRAMRPAEGTQVATLLYGSPSDEAVGIAGDRALAARLALALHAAGVARSPEDEVHVALLDGRLVAAALTRRRWGGGWTCCRV